MITTIKDKAGMVSSPVYKFSYYWTSTAWDHPLYKWGMALDIRGILR
ncbi:hypothetical protein [Bathymodiolus platifrons methanotrophic gill symbiont]|nr:hypothetical protein [Bathymodiolus platifrons methanotrophic gill symbiont]